MSSTETESMFVDRWESLMNKSTDDWNSLTDLQKAQLTTEIIPKLQRAAGLDIFLSSLLKQINQQEKTIDKAFVEDFTLARIVARQTILCSIADIKRLGDSNSIAFASSIKDGLETFSEKNIVIPSVYPDRDFRNQIGRFLTGLNTELQAIEYQMNWITPPWLFPKKIEE